MIARLSAFSMSTVDQDSTGILAWHEFYVDQNDQKFQL